MEADKITRGLNIENFCKIRDIKSTRNRYFVRYGQTSLTLIIELIPPDREIKSTKKLENWTLAKFIPRETNIKSPLRNFKVALCEG